MRGARHRWSRAAPVSEPRPPRARVGAAPAAWALLLGAAALAGCSGEGGEGGPWDHLLTPAPGEFLHVSSWDSTGGNRDRHEIAPGDNVVLLDVQGPGVIRRLWITVASSDPDHLRRIALRMSWDGEENPSVAVPLGDFFGNGFERRHYGALAMGTTSGGFYSYLPMPFAKRARIVAENGTGRVVDAFYFNADLELGGPLPRPLTTFHAAWNRDPRTTTSGPHTILEAEGEGHLVGVALSAESYDGSFGFLEGDEILTVDGSFRGQGTGTEDYFNGGWYFQDGPFAAPYHGVTLLDGERGRVAAYRWHLPDPIRFRDSLRVELEHGHGNEALADYATVAYWYQTEPHRPLPPLPPPDDRRTLGVKLPAGAVPADSLEILEEGGAATRVRFPVPRPDRYDLWLYPMGADGRPSPPRLLLGGVSAAGTTLEVDLPAGESRPAALHPVPVRRWADRWLVVGPFPNPQHIGTEYSPALDSIYAPEIDPDPARSYPGAGGESLRWIAIQGDSTGYVRLNPHFQPSDWVAAYALSFLYAPSAREATVLLGADDAHELWVDGEMVSFRQGRNISVADQLEIPVRLREGWNSVLLKVADLDGGWAFHLRVADPGGDLAWAPDPAGIRLP